MSNKLSYSQLSRFLMCGESHNLYYNKRIRSNVTSAALCLGSALDAALNILLIEKDLEKARIEFDEKWTTAYINKVETYLPTSTSLVYAKADFDKEVLTIEDQSLITNYFLSSKLVSVDQYNEGKQPMEVVMARKQQEAFINFTDAERKLFNFINWTCLRRKGFLILDAYNLEVMPRIKEVLSVQKKIEYKNEHGDSIGGVIDFVARLDDDQVYVLDNKSSFKEYDADSVKTSAQLALYAKHEGITKAGFVVFLKQPNKLKTKQCKVCGHVEEAGSRVKTCSSLSSGARCSGEFTEVVTCRGRVQIVLDEINPNMVEMTLGNFEKVNTMIDNKMYIKNTNSCLNWYGSKCPYYNLCHNGSKEGLTEDSNE